VDYSLKPLKSQRIGTGPLKITPVARLFLGKTREFVSIIFAAVATAGRRWNRQYGGM